ncbi:hypothetical protein [Microbulbifer sp. SAOS-129_SWC]
MTTVTTGGTGMKATGIDVIVVRRARIVVGRARIVAEAANMGLLA